MNHPWLQKRLTVYTRHDLAREHTSFRLLSARLTFAKSVTVSAAVSKIRIVLRQAWNESLWAVLLQCLTILTDVTCCQVRCGRYFTF